MEKSDKDIKNIDGVPRDRRVRDNSVQSSRTNKSDKSRISQKSVTKSKPKLKSEQQDNNESSNSYKSKKNISSKEINNDLVVQSNKSVPSKRSRKIINYGNERRKDSKNDLVDSVQVMARCLQMQAGVHALAIA